MTAMTAGTGMAAMAALLLLPPALLSPLAQDQAPRQAFRAMYDWGFASPSGEGKGILAVVVDTSTDRVVVELHALGERLMLLEGDGESGYRLLIPRNEIYERAPDLATLPIPFLPTLNGTKDLAGLLLDGAGPGIKASSRDSKGPKRLRWDGKDDRNQPCTVWLKRTRYEDLRTPPK